MNIFDVMTMKARAWIKTKGATALEDITTLGLNLANLAGAGRTTETVKANADAIALRELLANKVVAFQATPDDTHYPTEKLVDDRFKVLEGRTPKIYGFKKHKTTGVVTPLYDSVALGPIPVIDGSRPTGFVNPYAAINIFHWRSCLMNTKQQILAFYGQPGYDTPGASDSYEVQIPMAYVDAWDDDTYSYHVISEQQAMEGMFVPGGFRDPDGNIMPYAYVDKYRRGTVGSVSVSRPDVLPDVSQTMLQFETKAEAIDSTMLWTGCPEELDWYITFVAEIMALSTDTQAYYGQGMSSMPYSTSHVVTAVTTSANTVIVSNATAAAFKVSINVKLGSALGNSQTFADRTIQTITDNGDGSSTIVVDGDPFTTVAGYILHAHRQVTTSDEATGIGEDCGFILHDGRSEAQVENWINGIAGHGGDIYEFSFGLLRYDNQPYICHDRRQLKHNDDPRLNAAYRPCGFVYESASDVQWIKNVKLVGDKPYCIEWVSEGGAASTTHYADPAYYLTATYRGTRIVLRRFSWDRGSSCGRRGLNGSDVLSNSAWYLGWRSSPSKLIK